MLTTTTNCLKKRKQISASNGVNRQNSLEKISNDHINLESQTSCGKCVTMGKETSSGQSGSTHYPKE